MTRKREKRCVKERPSCQIFKAKILPLQLRRAQRVRGAQEIRVCISRLARRTTQDKTSSLIPPPHFCNDVRARRSTVRVQPYQPVSSAHGSTAAKPLLLLPFSIWGWSVAPVRFSEKRAPAASVAVFPVAPADDRHVMEQSQKASEHAGRRRASTQWHRLDPAAESKSTYHIKSKDRRRGKTSEIRTASTRRSDLIHGRRSGCSDSAHLHVHDSSSCSKR
ncbi:hypothetical protein BKA80DRAFT_41209 [Phyllosticta citrichinensis]